MHLAADLVDRRSHFLGGGCDGLDVLGSFLDAAATMVESCWVLSAVLVRLVAEASGSVEAADTVSMISPTAFSNWSASWCMSFFALLCGDAVLRNLGFSLWRAFPCWTMTAVWVAARAVPPIVPCARCR